MKELKYYSYLFILLLLLVLPNSLKAATPLKDNIKYSKQKPSELKSILANNEPTVNKKPHLFQNATTTNVTFEWNKTADGLYLPLTATVYYDYLEAFLLGVNLDAYFSHSSDCTNAIIYTIDDCFYFGNNITLMTNWSDPLLNISGLIGKNFSSAVLYCF